MNMNQSGTTHLPTKVIVGRLLREHIRRYIPQMLLAVVFMGLVAATTAAYAWLVQPILDEVFIEKDHSRLMAITIAVLAVFAIKGMADYAQTVIMAQVSMRIVADIRQRVFESLLRADLEFLKNPKKTLYKHDPMPSTLEFSGDAERRLLGEISHHVGSPDCPASYSALTAPVSLLDTYATPTTMSCVGTMLPVFTSSLNANDRTIALV